MTAIKRALTAIVLMLIFLLPARAEKAPPFDDTASLPGFAAFKQQLLSAISRHDAKFIMSITSPRIEFSFGGSSGLAAFRKEMDLDNPRAPFWTEFERILKLGGAYDKREKYVWFPYFFHRWPEKLSGLDYAVATGAAVPLRGQASASGKVLATLSWDIVELLPNNQPGAPWLKVRTPAKQVGWISRSQIYSPGWRRAAFQRINGRWTMTVYVQGD